MKKFVHADCRHAQDRVTHAHAAAAAAAADARSESHNGLPHGLSEKTLKDYKVEWSRYKNFVRETRATVPGKDIDWDMPLLWKYMRMRSATCKPTTLVQIATKLRHFGLRHGFVLATSKFDAKPSDYGAIRNMKRELSIEARSRAKAEGRQHAEVDRCTPIGKRGVDMILSSFRVFDRAAFQRLSRANRHHIYATVMQHTGGMRFGQVFTRDYTTDSFVQDNRDRSLRLITDYSRYAGLRQFCIEFEASPRYESMWYHVSDQDGTVRAVYPAATLMRWHFDRLRADGERHVFRPVIGDLGSRQSRQAWLRAALLTALPLDEHGARALIQDVTPHSFRAGLAGDLYREGIALTTIGSVCRWNSMYDVRIYSERPCMSMSRTNDKFRVVSGTRG